MTAYRNAGVDVAAGEELVERIKAAVKSTWPADVPGDFGGFAGGIGLPPGYADPIIVMSTDGLGTKSEVARAAGIFTGLGQDLVASCIDDLAAAGARPLAMTDYLTVGALDVAWAADLIESIAAACRNSGVALLGGETAEHPGVMDPDEFDLAGTAIGVMERSGGLDGSAVRAGDTIYGLASPNVRANGFSLIRQAVIPRLGLDSSLGDATLADVLLEPSVVYSPTVAEIRGAHDVHAMAHITGGGLPGNVKRVLPPGLDAAIDSSAWTMPSIFEVLAEVGEIEPADMFATFNMGVGFVFITDSGINHPVAFPIGTVTPGSGQVLIG